MHIFSLTDRQALIIKKALVAICILFIIFSSAVSIIASSYSVHQSDDFKYANELNEFSKSYDSMFVTSIEKAANEYMTWQGTWIVSFFRPLFMPLCRNGNSTLKTVQVILTFLLFLSLSAFVYLYLRKILKISAVISSVLCAVFIFVFSNYRVYYEVFYWYTGAIGYALPMIFCLLSLICIILFYNDKSKLWLTLACILGFISTGGTLGQVGFICYLALMIVIYYLIKNRKLFSPYAVYFCVLFAGAMFNVAAPGNYVRANGQIHLLSAIKNTFSVLLSEKQWLFHDTNILAILLIVFLISLFSDFQNSVSLKAYSAVSVLLLLSPIVCIFPVVLGYQMAYVANRGIFIVNIAAFIALFNISIVLGKIATMFFSKSEKKLFSSTVILAVLIISLNGNFSITNACSIKTAAQLMNGTIPNYYNECCEFFDYLSQNVGKDVVVDSYPQPVENFSNFYLEDGWVNEGIAGYYGLNSLTIKTE